MAWYDSRGCLCEICDYKNFADVITGQEHAANTHLSLFSPRCTEPFTDIGSEV